MGLIAKCNYCTTDPKTVLDLEEHDIYNLKHIRNLNWDFEKSPYDANVFVFYCPPCNTLRKQFLGVDTYFKKVSNVAEDKEYEIVEEKLKKPKVIKSKVDHTDHPKEIPIIDDGEWKVFVRQNAKDKTTTYKIKCIPCRYCNKKIDFSEKHKEKLRGASIATYRHEKKEHPKVYAKMNPRDSRKVIWKEITV